MNSSPISFYEFGPFRLDSSLPLLLRDGEPVPLPPKALETLVALVERSGRVVRREELIEVVWPDTVVEENNLSVNVSMLRKALGEGGEKYIETVPRRGYRFVASVREMATSIATESGSEQHEAQQPLIIDEPSEEIERMSAPKRGGADSWRRIAAWSLGVALLLSAAVAALYPGGRSAGRGVPAASVTIAQPVAGFDVEGRATTSFGFADEKAYAAVLQPDGKFVVAGAAGDIVGTWDFALARYNPDGSLDGTFGTDGKVVTAVGPITDIAYALALQPDGKIIAAGVSFTGTGNGTRRFALARYKPNGALDPSFDGDGLVTFGFGTRSMDTIYAIGVQADGHIVVAGSASMEVEASGVKIGQNDFALARLNPDGSPDGSFGHSGFLVTDFGNGPDIAYALILQPDGRIVAAGTATNGRNQDMALARYQPDGTLDETFGKAGKVRTNFFDEDEIAWALTLQPNGHIVVAGYTSHNSAIEFALARYTPEGLLDRTFGVGGKVATALSRAGEGDDTARAIALQGDGRIVVAGRIGMGVSPAFAFARYQPDGRLDASFDGDGTAQITFPQGGDACALALRPDGLLLAAGSAGTVKSSDFAVVRFRP